MNSDLSVLIKEEAIRIGFSDCGFAKADFLQEQKGHFCEWLSKKYHAGMRYMENNIEKRVDPRALFEDAKTVVVVSLNYYTDVDMLAKFKIAKYAYGADYHWVMKKKLNLLLEFINQRDPDCKAKICVDTVPILEKAWAERAGIGWIGKNTCLINKKKGSFLFLGELILNIELEYDSPAENYCGTCKRCIDACPTNALTEPYMLNANNCISYQTIESNEQIPDDIRKKSNGWIFGCDICQNVCPWNKFAIKHNINEFDAVEAVLKFADLGFDAFSLPGFEKSTRDAAISRVNKYYSTKKDF